MSIFKLAVIPVVGKTIMSGLSLSGLGIGFSWLIKPNIIENQHIGEFSSHETSDAQWMFLYLLAGKVFEYLKSQDSIKSSIEISEDTDLKSWLSSRFKKTTNQIGWKGFKNICSQIIKEENIPSFRVKISESRLCFMGERVKPSETNTYFKLLMDIAASKGNIRYIGASVPYSNIENLKDWRISNYDLWTGFIKDKGKEIKDDVNHSEWDSKFSEWFNDSNIKTSSEKNSKTISQALSTTKSQK